MSVDTVMPKSAFEYLQANSQACLVDVRTPVEFEEIHADGARLIPLDRISVDRLKGEVGDIAGRRIYFICRSGQRATQAAKQLTEAGIEDAHVIVGGTVAWEQDGLPVTRGRAAMSLERQVRIAAGSLVLLGVILSLTVHPWLIGLSAFVGAGLVFAGITDTCGMGMLLAKMPWNQRRGGSQPQSCNIRSA